MKKALMLSLAFLLVVTGILGLWQMDVSASASNTGGGMTNGLWNMDPALGFHMGLGMAIFSVCGLYLALLFVLVRDSGKRKGR